MNEPDTSETPNPSYQSEKRQTAKAVIHDIIRRHRKRANDLEAMLSMLPEVITNEQDEALWNVLSTIDRRA
jgi:hypothetical protein